MEKLKRYNVDGYDWGVVEEDDGDYVRYDDLKAALTQLVEERRHESVSLADIQELL